MSLYDISVLLFYASLVVGCIAIGMRLLDRFILAAARASYARSVDTTLRSEETSGRRVGRAVLPRDGVMVMFSPFLGAEDGWSEDTPLTVVWEDLTNQMRDFYTEEVTSPITVVVVFCTRDGRQRVYFTRYTPGEGLSPANLWLPAGGNVVRGYYPLVGVGMYFGDESSDHFGGLVCRDAVSGGAYVQPIGSDVVDAQPTPTEVLQPVANQKRTRRMVLD